MSYIRVTDHDRKQDVAINCDHIIKVSNEPLPAPSVDKFKTYINTSDGGTVRVMETVSEILDKIAGVATA